MPTSQSISIGVEEEYLLVDAETSELAARPPKAFMAACKEVLGPRVMHEFLQSQVEIGTGVCETVAEARAELRELRTTIAAQAEAHGMRMIAASTHPWAHWASQEPTDMDRYRILGAEHGSIARRMAICGMHVHAGIEDEDLRVEMMAQVSYFMPHLLALSASSPFWEGLDTGLKAFRPVIVGDLPRSGFPETFESWSDWLEMLDDLRTLGMVDDPTRIWWDIRPSVKHPTLEIRICDICTRLEDGLTIAALYQSILAYLHHLRRSNVQRRRYRRILLAENKWRAMRYGTEARLGDFGKRRTVPFVDHTHELIELVRPYAEDLGCLAEVEHAAVIAERGTSADEQLRLYGAALERGATEREAQEEVVRWLIEETVRLDP
jgi:carboxylate-amine ligase